MAPFPRVFFLEVSLHDNLYLVLHFFFVEARLYWTYVFSQFSCLVVYHPHCFFDFLIDE